MTKIKRLTLADVRREAAKHGATIDDRHSGMGWHEYVINIDLPAGKFWHANGLHNICEVCPKDVSNCVRDTCASAIERMAYGVGECTDPECEVCHPG